MTSSFGAFLDPVADKFLVTAALLVLVHLNRLNALVALVIIGREIAISALREWMAQIGASRSVAVHMLGKVKTVVQMIAIPFLLFDGRLFGLIDTAALGHGADLALGGPDDLVDGLLPAEGAARDPRPCPLAPGRRPPWRHHPGALARAMPWVFVLIWSTGFVVARLACRMRRRCRFLAIRFALSALCFFVWIALARAAWPRRARGSGCHLAVTGVFMQAGYLGGVWSAVRAGHRRRHGRAARRPAAGADRALAQPRGLARPARVGRTRSGWACCSAWPGSRSSSGASSVPAR